jgi:hypothetical protein
MCPYCESVLQGSERGVQGGALDSFLHRRGAKRRIIKLLLAVFGMVSLSVWAAVALILAWRFHRPKPFYAFLFFALLMALTGAWFVFQGARRNPKERMIGRAVMTFFAYAGVLTAVGCTGGVLLFLFRLVVDWVKG